MAVLKTLIVSLSFVLSAAAQQASPARTTDDGPAVVATETHENAVKLIELMGIRQKLDANIDKMVQQGTEKLRQEFPNFPPAFSEEWGKRMKARLKVEDFVNIVVKVYEKHYTNDDLVELIKAQKEVNESKTPAISPRLQEKVSKVSTLAMSEIMGGFTQLGAQLGGEIGKEIATEHPDWVKAESSAQTPLAKQ
jgi:uncharacterized protein YktA (UPF0223 family)